MIEQHLVCPDLVCPVCGHSSATSRCQRCHGHAHTLDRRRPIRPGRRSWLADLAGGLLDEYRAVFELLHNRAFIGKLRVPVIANAIVFSACMATGYFVLRPLFAAAFASPWWLIDALRAQHTDHGPGLWLATTWMVLGQPALEACAGALHENLHDAAEGAMLDVPASRPVAARRTLGRLRDRAKLCLAALLLLPFLLVVVLLPWIGLPLVFALSALLAACVWFELPMSRRGLDLRQRLRLVWRNRWRALGLGGSVQFASAVPFLNLLGLSATATIAASSAYLALDKNLPAESPRHRVARPGTHPGSGS